MRIAIIGQGAIAQYLRRHIEAYQIHEVAGIVRPGKEAAGRWPLVSDIADLSQRPDLIVDCGGHAALAAHGPIALVQGLDVVTVSLGALADADLYAKLLDAATHGGARLHLTSGAIGGLDALRGASIGTLSAVTYTARKPPKGWIGSPAEKVLDLDSITTPTAHFTGTARQAALAYPKNANVAAAVALSGVGFDDTQVTLIADPTINANMHQIHAEGTFGTMDFSIAGHGLPDNPKSSALAAMSMLADLAERQKRIGF